MKTFFELDLRPEILRAIKDSGYDTPTPIQAKAIPVALTGVDLLGIAQTGTGKTAGFLLPTLQRLAVRGRGRLRALVLTPTRELAAQIADSVQTYGKYLPLRHAVVFGGVGFGPQKQQLKQGVDIVVATPGRLLDHMGQGTISFSSLEVLILDEADRMCDMGFLPDVRRILKSLPTARQTLFFSATMPDEIERLSREMLKNPVLIEAGPRARTVDTVRQVAYAVPGDLKKEAVAHLLAQGHMRHVLVFTRTKARADRLARFLSHGGRQVEALHGNKSQNARTRALGKFKSGQVDVLVATDIAARGIDVDGISHVINFDMPNVPEDYVHRIGRTARADASGDAVSLVSREEEGYVRTIERLTGVAIEKLTLDGFAPQPGAFSERREAAHFRGRRPTNRPAQGYGRSGHHGRPPHSGSRSTQSHHGRTGHYSNPAQPAAAASGAHAHRGASSPHPGRAAHQPAGVAPNGSTNGPSGGGRKWFPKRRGKKFGGGR